MVTWIKFVDFLNGNLFSKNTEKNIAKMFTVTYFFCFCESINFCARSIPHSFYFFSHKIMKKEKISVQPYCVHSSSPSHTNRLSSWHVGFEALCAAAAYNRSLLGPPTLLGLEKKSSSPYTHIRDTSRITLPSENGKVFQLVLFAHFFNAGSAVRGSLVTNIMLPFLYDHE